MKEAVTKDNVALLTIIIPCYNAEKYLNRCLSGLENLNREDISLLFINDGSIDSTQGILEEWILNHVNARMITKENGGYATAINMGLDHCCTEYVMFMGVDDEIVPNGIARVCQTLRKEKPDILAFSTVKHYDDVNVSDNQIEIDDMTKYTNPGFYSSNAYDLYEKLGRDMWILYVRDTSRCFKMSLLEGLRYFGKTGVSADGCFSSLAACRARCFSFVNEICYVWHVHKDSVSGRTKTLDKIIEEADVWAAFFQHIEKNFTHIPNPIVGHYFTYRGLIQILRNDGMMDLAHKHEKNAKNFSTWALRKASMTKKSRCKLMFPKLFNLCLRALL